MKRKKNDKFKEGVGKRLFHYRDSLGINVIKFSKKIKISQGTLSELENGISAPSARTLANLCAYTNVDIEWLLTGNSKNTNH